MPKQLDKSKVENALKRAARAAVSGNRDERAGKFILRDAATGRFLNDHFLDDRRKSNPKK
jgi:hypothetical protein